MMRSSISLKQSADKALNVEDKVRISCKPASGTLEPLQGRSLLPIFRGETRQSHETLYFHFGSDRALRQGPWKLVSAKLGKWELYNLDEDRTELNDLSDLSGQNSERVAAMEKEWFRMAEHVLVKRP